jgi:hypothetical protein
MKHVRTNVVTLLAGVQLMQSSTAATAFDCSDLKRLASRALTGEKFASIAGKAWDGNFFDTTLCCSLNTALNFACVLCDHGSCRLQVGATAPFMGQNLHLRFTGVDERARSRADTSGTPARNRSLLRQHLDRGA